MRDQLQIQCYMSEVFTFVDSTYLISKANLWAERDKAIKAIVFTLRFYLA